MTVWILLAVGAGIAAGHWLIPVNVYGHLDNITTVALAALVFGVGIDVGRNRSVWQRMRSMGVKIVAIPLMVALGSIAGAAIAGRVLGMPFNESSAIGAGFGWYSLSGIILAQIYNVETGALAFLANVIREVMALVMIPFLVRHVGRLAAIAPGGATTMDTTLPLIVRFAGPDTAVIAFFSGVVLTMAVPLLVPLLINL